MNQTQVLDWTPVVETAFPEWPPEYLRPEDTDIMRARLLLADIWRQIFPLERFTAGRASWINEISNQGFFFDVVVRGFELTMFWERMFREDGSLMMLIRDYENNSVLFLSTVAINELLCMKNAGAQIAMDFS